VLVMIIIVIAFILTVKSGQYDDLEGPAYRILMDDDDPRIPGNPINKDDPTDSLTDVVGNNKEREVD